ETYTSNAGLTLVGQCIQLSLLEKSPFQKQQVGGIRHSDILKSYLSMACLGKSDFEAIENYRKDAYLQEAIGISHVPSSSRLRQRMDEQADDYRTVIDTSMMNFMIKARVPVTELPSGHVVLDLDVFPMDNSKTKKEGVSRTYKGHDGYAPLAAYLGEEGWCIACELREGKQHGQKEFIHTLERVIPRARSLTSLPLLMRLDSGHDALENRLYLNDENVDYLIKWNPRREKKKSGMWLEKAEKLGDQVIWEAPRQGKRVATFSVTVKQEIDGVFQTFRRVMQITERTIDKKGQGLLIPDIEVEGWWTSLKMTDQEIIELYKQHATSEQFHSEFKTDLDVERLPSGKFDTNDLVLACHAFAYNMLRFIGLVGLMGKNSPVRHTAKRRRIKTVLQELMYLAARVMKRSRQHWLRFSKHCAAYSAFGQIYRHLASL
ncbi:Mobile element protein, partial [hydrothermal vent metagenome]